MLPILRVLINEDTLQGWVDREVAGKRFDITLIEEARVGEDHMRRYLRAG